MGGKNDVVLPTVQGNYPPLPRAIPCQKLKAPAASQGDCTVCPPIEKKPQ